MIRHRCDIPSNRVLAAASLATIYLQLTIHPGHEKKNEPAGVGYFRPGRTVARGAVRMMPLLIRSPQISFNNAAVSRVARLIGRPCGRASTRSARIQGNSAIERSPASTS